MPPKRKQPSSTITNKPSSTPPKAPSQTTLGSLKGGLQLSAKSSQKQDSPTFSITFDGKEITCQRFPSSSKAKDEPPPDLIFTHGAGGGIANPATSLFAQGFSQQSPSSVVCFQGTMNMPSRVKYFHAVIDDQEAEDAVLGGRSMGARAAVVAMNESGRKTGKLVLASYPLIGMNKEVRDKILLDSDEGVEVLFISGDGDNMCPLADLAEVRKKMKAKSWLITVKGADHGMSLKPKEAVEKMRLFTGEAAARWANGEGKEDGKPDCVLRWDAHERKVVDEGWKTAEGASKPTTQDKTNASKTDEKAQKKTRKDDAEEDVEKSKAPPSKRRKRA